jgi:hypothetical protein
MCRTGCRTKDHESYAECLRSAAIQLGPLETNSKAIHRELDAYANARRQGIQPAGTKLHQTEAAVRVSQDAGYAWDSAKGQFKTGGE